MAETSYPFSQANDSGGSEMVSQEQWQKMGHLWGGDRIDFRLTANSYDSGSLPFAVRVVNTRDVEVQPGRAWVGGFLYELDAAQTVSVDPNLTDKARLDTIVIRADLTKGSVNLAVVKGQPSASPIAPQPQRVLGQFWEMVIYEVSAPANNGAISLNSRFAFDMPPSVASPWNTRDTTTYLDNGTLIYDMDVNGGDTQYEAFKGRDGYVVTRHFGVSRTYTPNLLNGTSNPAAQYRIGRWRFIAPNMVWFSVTLNNPATSDIKVSGSNWQLGVSLPIPASGKTGQVMKGYMSNGAVKGGLPNFVDLTALIGKGNTTSGAYFTYPNSTQLAQGLDGLRVFPSKATITLSGIYEADSFSE